MTERVDADDGLAVELAAVRDWASALNRASYKFTQPNEGIVVDQKVDPEVDPEVEKALAHTNEDSRRRNHGYRLWNRYPERHDRHAKYAPVTLEELIDDIAVAKDLLKNPPELGPGSRYDAPAAVAAATLEAQFKDGLDVPPEELVWSAGVLLDVVENRKSIHPNDRDEFSYSLVVGTVLQPEVCCFCSYRRPQGFESNSRQLADSPMIRSVTTCRRGAWNGDGRAEPTDRWHRPAALADAH